MSPIVSAAQRGAEAVVAETRKRFDNQGPRRTVVVDEYAVRVERVVAYWNERLTESLSRG